MYPLIFNPLFQERVWGGRQLASVFNKPLPEGKIIGESWEICDRPEANTCVANGEWKGQTLHEIIEREGKRLMGNVPLLKGRFPLLIKLLDARERLSLQVHPPLSVSEELKGEPKTEMWYIAEASPDAHLIAGLKKGVTRAGFESALQSNALEPLCHRFPVKAGDSMFLPSGRLHAIDAGSVIVEIQQNSDTTYRVYDWGRPREIHVAQSLKSIFFDDFEPALSAKAAQASQTHQTLASCEYFTVEKNTTFESLKRLRKTDRFEVWVILDGRAKLNGHEIGKGDSLIIPAALDTLDISITSGPLSWIESKVP